MNKFVGILLSLALYELAISAVALAAEDAKSTSTYSTPQCVRPNKASVYRPRGYIGDIGMDRVQPGRDERVVAYNRSAQDYNACMLTYIATADTGIKKLHDEAFAHIKQVIDDSNLQIKGVERQINDVVNEANGGGIPAALRQAVSSEYPVSDCKKPIEPKSGQHTIQQTAKYDQDYRTYRVCVSEYIEGAKVEIRQLSNLTRNETAQIAKIANIRMASIQETVNHEIADANMASQSEGKFFPPSASVITVTPSDTEPVTAGEARIQRTADSPTGEGDPDAISCRLPQQRPDTRLLGPEICKRNRDWAHLRSAGDDISPDGRSVVPSEKRRTTQSTASTCFHLEGGDVCY
jgi:hypothetical protein